VGTAEQIHYNFIAIGRDRGKVGTFAQECGLGIGLQAFGFRLSVSGQAWQFTLLLKPNA